jgi:hypothetical protein
LIASDGLAAFARFRQSGARGHDALEHSGLDASGLLNRPVIAVADWTATPVVSGQLTGVAPSLRPRPSTDRSRTRA